jgi:DNA-binding MarR family transcriptional regulator
MATPRWLDDRERQLWMTWLRVNQELPALLSELMSRGSGLSAADYAVLVPLSEAPDDTLRFRDLARLILWDRSRLSHQVRRMEERGMVAREECAEDARGAMVRMTARGRVAIESAAPGHVEATRRYFFDLLSDDELEVLTRVYERVVANLPSDSASD